MKPTSAPLYEVIGGNKIYLFVPYMSSTFVSEYGAPWIELGKEKRWQEFLSRTIST